MAKEMDEMRGCLEELERLKRSLQLELDNLVSYNEPFYRYFCNVCLC